MAARTGRTTYVPGRGSTTRSKSGRAKTYTGSGPAPAGTKKVREPSYSEVPTVTVTSSGTTTSGYRSRKAAKRAVRAQKKRARRIEQVVAETMREPRERHLGPMKPPHSYKAPARPKSAPKRTRFDDNPQTAVITSSPNPLAKPPTFQGHKTAGEPSRRELQKAAKKGALRVNRKGHVTTPRIRKVGGELRRLRSKARSSNAPLPGLDSEGTRVARKVLKTGRKMGANRKELLAATETGLVESSGFHNLHGGDADSEGWRQERVSLFGSDAIHPKKGAQNFFNEAKAQPGATAGALAANVQRPAEQYRGRYDEVKPEAAAILNAFEKGGLKPGQQKQLQKVSKEAKELGLKAGGATKGPPPKRLVTRFKAAKIAMKEVEGTPYVWGGGHNSGKVNPTGGLDCSGAVSYVLQHVGVKLPGGVTSGDMGAYLKPGPGLLTVYYNAGHTFLKLGDEYWGTSVGDSGAGGLGPHPSPSSSYLSQYNVGHVPGMGRKQLLQMGFKPGKSFASPGITYSEGGTVATVDPGAAVTKDGKPGFSKMPISSLQKYKQTKKALHELGVGESSTTTPHSSGSVLDAMERKYGVAA